MKHILLSFILSCFFIGGITAQWTQLTSSDLELPVPEAVIKHGTAWYIGTPGGVFKTTDNGLNWVLSNNGLYNNLGRLRVEGFASSGSNIIAMNRWDGIVTSTDGSSWTAFNDAALPSNYFISETMVVVGSRVIIAVKDNDTDIYYLYYSTDNGSNWTQGVTLTGAGSDVYLYSIGTKAFVTHYSGGSSSFLGETTDGTALTAPTFTPAYPGTAIENVIKADDYILVAGESSIYRYDLINDGWTDLSGVWTNGIAFINVAGNNDALVYASVLEGNNNVGSHVSTDYGDSWTPISVTLPVGKGFAMGLYATGNEFMASFIDDGMHYSSDAGANTARRNNKALSTDFDELIVSGGNLLTRLFISGIYGSSNNGGDWTKWNTGLPADPIQSVSDFTSDGTNLFVNYYNSPDDNPSPNKVFKSTDNGVNWNELTPPGTYTNLQVLGANGNTLFAHSNDPNSAYLTTSNGGTSWADITIGIPANFTPMMVTGDGTTAYLLGYDTSTPGENYPNVYTSANNGATGWTLTMTGINTANLQMMDDDEDLLLLTPEPGKAFFPVRYQDWDHRLFRWNVNTWEEVVNPSGLNNLDFESMAYHNGDLYVSSWNSGVHRSSNDGSSFTKLGNLEDGLSAEAMAFIGDLIYVSTNRGIWYYDITTSIQKTSMQSDLLLQPNPTSGPVTVNLQASKASVYSLTGTLVKEVILNGQSFDISELSNGVYILSLTTQQGTVITKLVKQ